MEIDLLQLLLGQMKAMKDQIKALEIKLEIADDLAGLRRVSASCNPTVQTDRAALAPPWD